MRAHLFKLFVVVALLGIVAAAVQAQTAPGPVLPLGIWDRFVRADMPVWGHSQAVTDTGVLVSTSTGTDGRVALFPYDSLAVIEDCDSAVYACWVQAAPDDFEDGHVVDGDPILGPASGSGACRRCSPGIPCDMPLFAGRFDRSIPTHRSKGCSGVAEVHGYPCRVDADCIYAAATCEAAVRPQGAFLFIASVAATAECHVRTGR